MVSGHLGKRVDPNTGFKVEAERAAWPVPILIPFVLHSECERLSSYCHLVLFLSQRSAGAQRAFKTWLAPLVALDLPSLDARLIGADTEVLHLRVSAEGETVEIPGMIALTRARREGLTIGTTGSETVIGTRTDIETTATVRETGIGTDPIVTETEAEVESTSGIDLERGRGTGKEGTMIGTGVVRILMRNVGG